MRSSCGTHTTTIIIVVHDEGFTSKTIHCFRDWGLRAPELYYHKYHINIRIYMFLLERRGYNNSSSGIYEVPV